MADVTPIPVRRDDPVIDRLMVEMFEEARAANPGSDWLRDVGPEALRDDAVLAYLKGRRPRGCA